MKINFRYVEWLLVFISLCSITFGKIKLSQNNVVPGVVVIKFKSQTYLKKNASDLSAEITKQFRIKRLERVFQSKSGLMKTDPKFNQYQNIYYVYFSQEFSPVEVAAALSKEPAVVYAEPKYMQYIDAIPNDTLYDAQTFYSQVMAPQAWDLIRGEDGSAVVAVVDGGTEIHHPDIAANLWNNPGEIANDGIDNDNNGFIDDYHGWNFANNTPDPTGLPWTPNNAGHGTHTAGLISAVSNNITGVAGMSWNARLMAINVGSPVSDDELTYGFDGIIYAVENGAKIISCSWGYSGSGSSFEQDVIRYAVAQGAVVIAAAGNENSSQTHYPAAYSSVLAVAAVNSDDSKAVYSNFGDYVDVSAPGSGILSTYSDFGYAFLGGTSMACPIVAGLAGLVSTQNPDWNGLQCAEQVRVTCDQIDYKNPGYADQLGKGRINAYRALTESHASILLTDKRFTDENGNSIIDAGETIQLYLTFTNYLEDAENVSIVLDTDDPFITITSDAQSLDEIKSLQSVESEPFTISVGENTPAGHPAKFYVNISTADQEDQYAFYLTVLPFFATVSVNSIETTITSIGRIGFAYLGYDEDGIGFRYHSGTNLLYEGAVIAGTDAAHVINAARGEIDGVLLWDEDYSVVDGEELQINTPGSVTDEESHTVFDDRNAAQPLNIRVTQETYADSTPEYSDFVLLKYTVTNTGNQNINNFHFGLFFDWDIDGSSAGTNIIGFDNNHRLGFAYDNSGMGPDTYAGAALLTSGNLSFRAIMNNESDPGNPSWGIYDGFSDAEKWEAISGGVQYTKTVSGDVSFVIASGPHLIRKGGFVEIGFALIAGSDSAALVAHAQAASGLWQELDLVDDINPEPVNEIPYHFELQQNYPNPFNAATKITFQIAELSYTRLDIYTLNGRHVVNLVTGNKSTGSYSVTWDGRDEKNHPVSSGMYICRLKAGNYINTRKLLYIK